MSKVHVFVDATHFREDGANEYDVYFKYLRDHGFAEVYVHPGGVGLRKQYERIFAFFKEEPEIILTSDTVPRIDWHRRRHLVFQICARQLWLIRIGFDICVIVESTEQERGHCRVAKQV